MRIKQWIINLIKNIRLTLTDPSAQLSRGQKTLRYSWELSRHCTQELKHDKAPQMAAALTYHTLFSLMPTLVLALVVMQIFVSDAERQQFKQTIVNLVLDPLTDETPDQQAPTPIDENNLNLSDDVATAKAQALAKRKEFNNVRKQLEDNIQTVITSLENINFKSIGLVGVLVFIWGATGLLTSIEKSFNAIFGVTSGRLWYMRLPIYLTVIIFGPIFMLLGIWMQDQFFAIMEQLTWLSWLMGILGTIMPVITTWLALMLVFLLLPTAKVSIRAAAFGSFVAGLGWVIAAAGFSIYVKTAAGSTLYGALGLLPLFLLWLWLTWLIILFGLELTYTLQNMKGKRFKSSDSNQNNNVLIDHTWLTTLAALLAQAFIHGKTLNAIQIEEQLNLPHRIVNPMLNALIKANIIHHLNDDDNNDEVGYTLARPAERIGLHEILKAAQTLQPNIPDTKTPQWQFVRQHAANLLSDSKKQTLADLTK